MSAESQLESRLTYHEVHLINASKTGTQHLVQKERKKKQKIELRARNPRHDTAAVES